MRKYTTTKERYVGINYLSKISGIHKFTIHYWSVRNNFRFYKFSNVRYLEITDALCLMEKLIKDPQKLQTLTSQLQP